MLPFLAEGQERRILIVPFDQFQFESAVSLEEIASYNEWEDSRITYEEYNQSIIGYLNSFSDSTLFFHPSESDIEYIRRVSPRVYKREPVSHFGIDIEPLMEQDKLASLMTNMDADYILFFSRYKIVGKLIPSRANVATTGSFIAWSNHFIDYEIYDPKGVLVAGADRFPYEPKGPTAKSYLSKGTLVSGLEKPSSKLSLDIRTKIEKFEKKGKPVFKSKIK